MNKTTPEIATAINALVSMLQGLPSVRPDAFFANGVTYVLHPDGEYRPSPTTAVVDEDE